MVKAHLCNVCKWPLNITMWPKRFFFFFFASSFEFRSSFYYLVFAPRTCRTHPAPITWIIFFRPWNSPFLGNYFAFAITVTAVRLEPISPKHLEHLLQLTFIIMHQKTKLSEWNIASKFLSHYEKKNNKLFPLKILCEKAYWNIYIPKRTRNWMPNSRTEKRKLSICSNRSIS